MKMELLASAVVSHHTAKSHVSFSHSDGTQSEKFDRLPTPPHYPLIQYFSKINRQPVSNCPENTVHLTSTFDMSLSAHVNTVEPEFYDPPFYDHLSYMTSFSGMDNL